MIADGARAASPILLGEQFSAADVMIGSTARLGAVRSGCWAIGRPLADYVARLISRPAYQRAHGRLTSGAPVIGP